MYPSQKNSTQNVMFLFHDVPVVLCTHKLSIPYYDWNLFQTFKNIRFMDLMLMVINPI